MPEQLQRSLIQWMIGLSLVLTTSAASAQPCCECRCPRNDVPACSEDFGLDEAAYLTAVCAPLGCSSAVCTNKPCARANRCPRAESGRCGDGFDNDADRLTDCADPDCTGADACVDQPSPTMPPVGTPAETPSETPATAAPTTSPNTTPPPTAAGSPTPNGESSCCVTQDETPGCDVAACESCVCDLDDFCCDEVWDANCVAAANDECLDLCLCGIVTTPTPSATPDPSRSPGPASNCCSGRAPEDGPGCSLAVCETCVCDVDDFCCTEFWDQGCADIADEGCLADCFCDTAPPLATHTPSPAVTPSPPTPSAVPTTPRPRCDTSDDCPGSQICTASGQCVGRPPTQGGNGGGGGGGGCAVTPASVRRVQGAWLLLPGLLWAIAGRRRRKR